MLEQIGLYVAMAGLILAIPLGIGLLFNLRKQSFTELPTWLQWNAGIVASLALIFAAGFIAGVLVP